MLFRKARLTVPAILFLVLLRVAIGWHFFQEGATKVRDGNFSSTPFLAAAKGPFAKQFHAMIPDYDGAMRTDPVKMEELTGAFVDKAVKEFGLSDEQEKEAREILKKSRDKLEETYFTDEQRRDWKKIEKEFTEGKKAIEKKIDDKELDASEAQKQVEALKKRFDDSRADVLSKESPITEFRKGMDRLSKLEEDRSRSKVESLRKQRDEIESKWRSLGRPILAEIDETVKELEAGVNAIATDEQAAPDPNKPPTSFDGKPVRKQVAFKYPGEGDLTVRQVDRIIPIFDMVVGILLLVGLLTPLAGLAAGLFLVSVVVSQFPGYAGTQPTYYQAIEMFACFLVAFADAGRYAGLDFLPWSLWNRNAKVPAKA
jgi:uncharacterized membrane protein YphA (DoxX/SURF4 family)